MKKIVTTLLVAIFAIGGFSKELESRFITTETSKHAYEKPVDSLSYEEEDRFVLGKSFFRIPWVEPPSATTARDGLGPLFSANTCTSCHPRNGAGQLFSATDVSRSLVARLSEKNPIRSLEQEEGFIPHRVYGAQLSINSVPGVLPEGQIALDFEKRVTTYPDGSIKELVKPKAKLTDLGYGKFDGVLSLRLSPPLIGLGLLEKLTDEQILKNQDVNDRDKDGIFGVANIVYSKELHKKAVGRYTYKASVATVREQVAVAMHNDMGLTTSLYPQENCTAEQTSCQNAPKAVDAIDVVDLRLDAVSFYVQNHKIPQFRSASKKGEALFSEIGCAKCHTRSFETEHGTIYPFSDLLLHDMGEELADGRREFDASKKMWRTTPLWGLSLRSKVLGESARLLHDGRARDVEEAILWHGGEAQEVKKRFQALSKELRKELIVFVEGL